MRDSFVVICRKDHGGSYYKCNKYEEESATSTGGAKMSGEDATRMAKKELDRYLHYFNRFQGHEAGIKFAATNQRASIERKIREIQVRPLSCCD